MVTKRDIQIAAVLLIVALVIAWAMLGFPVAEAKSYPVFKHPGYPGALAYTSGWDRRYDNRFWDECLWHNNRWKRWSPPTLLHLWWDEAHLYKRHDVTVPKTHNCPARPK